MVLMLVLLAAAALLPHAGTASAVLRGGGTRRLRADSVSAPGGEDDLPLLAATSTADQGGRPVRGLKIKPHKNLEKEAAQKKVRIQGGKRRCGVTRGVSSASEKYELCPAECPYSVQDKTDQFHCTFRCVQAAECSKYNPTSPVKDDKLHVCRPPVVDGCEKGKLDGTDSCETCQSYFTLHADGQCYFDYMFVVYGIISVLVLIFLIVLVWYMDMECRSITCERGYDHGRHYRERAMLHQPMKPGETEQELWPYSTQLTKEQVAGPGFVLHMNFQVAVIIWAVMVALGWVVLALIVDHDLFVLGTRKFETPRDRCILVMWGYETQKRLMWTKILFLSMVYVGTFLCCIFHGMRQQRLYESMDATTKTMKDFAAFCVGIPTTLTGEDEPERKLKKRATEVFGKSVVGVSICWNIGENDELLQAALRDHCDQRAATRRMAGTGHVNDEELISAEEHTNFLTKQFHAVETSLLGAADPLTPEQVTEVRDILRKMNCSENAFIIFDTEDARDAAIEQVKDSGFTFEQSNVQLESVEHEPDTCVWNAFDNSSTMQKAFRFTKGFGLIGLGLILWTTVFYGPYAFSLYVFNYDGGKEPGFIYGISFSMVVVVGNAIMYYVCGMVSENVGYKWIAQREQCYTVTYTIACTFNIMVDMITTYWMARKIALGLGFRLYDGTKLGDVDDFTEEFESYAMQRSLAENTFAYAFPSTFLIPFLIEPVATILAPWRLGILIARSHRNFMGRAAEDIMLPLPMDLGRYADILLNMVLGIMIFFFPGGYTHTLFLAMAGSQIYIYYLDHFKVLRAIPAIEYTGMNIDWTAQAMLAPCTGLIMSCLVFKMSGQGYGYDLEEWELVYACAAAFVIHCIVHVTVLAVVVPKLKGLVPKFFLPAFKGDGDEAATFKDIARKYAASWFNTNPVHCLRSKWIYNDKIPCDPWFLGKEHLMRVNEEINCYFQCQRHVVEKEELEKAKSWSSWLGVQA